MPAHRATPLEERLRRHVKALAGAHYDTVPGSPGADDNASGVAGAFRSVSDFPAERLASPAIVPGVSWSDQLSFWRAGYPAVMVTDTAFHRYPHYHQPTDTPERLDYPRMARVVEGLARAIARLAGGGAPPP